MWELYSNPIWQELRVFIKDLDYSRLQLSQDPAVCMKVNNFMTARKGLFDEVERWANTEVGATTDEPTQ